MTKQAKVVKVPTVKGFSSHPGHGDASKTVAQFQKAVDRFNSDFPAEAQAERTDHVARTRGRS